MSDVNGYGKILAKSLEIASEVRFQGASDNSNVVTLECNDPASSFTIDLPAQAGTILCDADDIAITQLDINGATEQSTPVNTHLIAVYDGSANKKMTLANLAGLSDFQSLPSGSDANVIVYDSANAAQAVSMSGDVTIDNTGEATVVDKPSATKSAEANKFLQVDANRDIDNVNVMECATVAGTNVEVGNGSNRWQFNIDGSGNLELKYSSDSGSTFATKQIFNNA